VLSGAHTLHTHSTRAGTRTRWLTRCHPPALRAPPRAPLPPPLPQGGDADQLRLRRRLGRGGGLRAHRSHAHARHGHARQAGRCECACARATRQPRRGPHLCRCVVSCCLLSISISISISIASLHVRALLSVRTGRTEAATHASHPLSRADRVRVRTAAPPPYRLRRRRCAESVDRRRPPRAIILILIQPFALELVTPINPMHHETRCIVCCLIPANNSLIE